ncbi:hypothetical protein CEXT_672211 [Caerostris extrusa]|uniref:Uncharacterized protein n=1 Tax=Caerostris extrusa TaxID=172846 RepID=A0AAV4NDV0_CAEEX|nr:hypothetical protein CEXT_672211 [Caerostris extrusa]
MSDLLLHHWGGDRKSFGGVSLWVEEMRIVCIKEWRSQVGAGLNRTDLSINILKDRNFTRLFNESQFESISRDIPSVSDRGPERFSGQLQC